MVILSTTAAIFVSRLHVMRPGCLQSLNCAVAKTTESRMLNSTMLKCKNRRESIRNVLNASKFNSIKYLVLLGLCRKLLPVGTPGQFIKERLCAFLLAPMRCLSAIGKTCWDTLLRLLVLEEEASQAHGDGISFEDLLSILAPTMPIIQDVHLTSCLHHNS
ncbi:hypothetical protein Tco_1487323, partial [Tanacetum coccineum]